MGTHINTNNIDIVPIASTATAPATTHVTSTTPPHVTTATTPVTNHVTTNTPPHVTTATTPVTNHVTTNTTPHVTTATAPVTDHIVTTTTITSDEQHEVEVRVFLEQNRLSQYADAFIGEGYDDLETVLDMD